MDIKELNKNSMGEVELMTDEEIKENLKALAELHNDKILNDMTNWYMSEYGYPYKDKN